MLEGLQQLLLDVGSLAEEIKLRAVPLNILVVVLIAVLSEALARALRHGPPRTRSLLRYSAAAWAINAAYLFAEILSSKTIGTSIENAKQAFTLVSCLLMLAGVASFFQGRGSRILFRCSLLLATLAIAVRVTTVDSIDSLTLPYISIIHALIHIAALIALALAIRHAIGLQRRYRTARTITTTSLTLYAALQVLFPVVMIYKTYAPACEAIGFTLGPIFKLGYGYGLLAYAVVILRDRVHQQAEREIIERQRMFISETAHELMTPVTALAGFADYIEKHPTHRRALRRATSGMVQVAHSISALIYAADSRLKRENTRLDFASPSDEPTLVSSNTLCQLAIMQVTEAQEKTVRLQTRYRIDVPVMVSVWTIVQSLVNIINNAYDAVSDDGEIYIETRRARNSEIATHRGPESDPRAYVAICVRDSGTGIDPLALARIFEYGFSTTGGRGIGLAKTRREIEANDGWISVQRGERYGSKGTVFKVFFPSQSSSRPKVSS